MLRSSLLLAALALTSARTPSPDPRVEARWRPGSLDLALLAPPGEHIAPEVGARGWVRLDGGRLEFATEGRTLARGLLFPLSDAPNHQLEGAISCALCRDDSTTCRPVSLTFRGRIAGASGALMLEEVAGATGGGAAGPDAADPAAAFSRAKTSGKRVLLDFSTLWCPPCQLLGAEVLHDPADAELLARFEVVLIDADAPASYPWKDRYQVRGYPTVIVADAEGAVIARMLGYDGERAFLDWLESAAAAPTPVAELLGALGDLPAAQLAPAARRLLDEGHRAEALALIARIPQPGERASLQFKAEPTHELLRVLATDRVDAIMDWIWTAVYELFEQGEVPEESRELVRAAATRGLRRVAPEQAAELAYILGDLTPEDRHPERIFALGAAIYSATFEGDPILDRGRYVFLATLHDRAGDHEAALAVLDEAIAAFPAEFTYHFERAELLAERGRLDDALVASRRAAEHAYGDMDLRSGRQSAQLLAKLGREPEAIALLKRTLDQAQRPKESEQVRTWRYLELLEALLGELEEPK